MSESWENQDNGWNTNSWDNNTNTSNNHDSWGSHEEESSSIDNTDSDLDALLGDDNTTENTVEDNSDNSMEASDTHTSDEESDKEEDSSALLDYDNIKDHLVNPPSNVKADKIFSEKDVYGIINVINILEECDEDMVKQVESTLDVSGKENVRRAMNISKMEPETFEEKAAAVTAIKAVYDAMSSSDNTMLSTLEAIRQIDSLTDKQRSAALSLMRKVLRDSGQKTTRISSTRNSPSVDVVSDIVSVMTGDDSIADRIVSVGTVVDSIAKVIH